MKKYASYIPTILGCSLMIAITLPRHLGVLLVLFVLILVSSIVGIMIPFVFKGKPLLESMLKTKCIKTALWTACFFAVFAKHEIDDRNVRDVADRVSRAVVAYHALHGHYPEVLSETRLSGLNIKEDINHKSSKIKEYHIIYSRHDDTPALYYRSIWVAYDIYLFDFKKKAWKYLSG